MQDILYEQTYDIKQNNDIINCPAGYTPSQNSANLYVCNKNNYIYINLNMIKFYVASIFI